MLTRLLSKLLKRTPRSWTEHEIRELIARGTLDAAQTAVEQLHPATPEWELRQLCLQGEIAFRNHRDGDADSLYSQALKLAPGFAEAHHGLSLLMQARGNYDAAFQHALFAKNSAPADPRYLAQLGLCHLYLGNFPQAEESLRHALRYTPEDKSIWNNLGIALLSRKQIAEARSCFLNALRLEPNFSPARQNLEQLDADTHLARTSPDTAGREDDALDHFLSENSDDLQSLALSANFARESWHAAWEQIRALAIQGQRQAAFASAEMLLLAHPDSDVLALLTDRLYRGLGEADSGLAVLQAFLVRHPDSATAHQGMGEALLHLSDYATAETHLKRAQALGADDQNLLKALSRTLLKQDRYAEALPYCEECQDRWPSDVNLTYVAVAHYQTCDYARALSCFETLQAKGAIDRFGLQFTYAQALAYAGRIEEALPIMDRQIERLGNAPYLRVHRAFMHLLMEDFAPGWDGYRHRQLGLRAFRILPVPEWQGEDLTGKTIVVLAEQGLGDQIMFASCLPDLLAQKPARVVVEVVDRVAPTLARSFPDCEVIASRQDKNLSWLRDIEEVDCFIPITELPRHFRRDLQSFPRQPYLRPDPERIRYWRSRLESLGPGPYFGTSWRGGTEYTRSAIRTLSPDLLLPLVSALPSQWISLQYGKVQEELARATRGGVHLTHWPEAITDLDEFAALVAALDGVFTVCNTTVHYAGAVGQRVWVLAPVIPEWRYGLYNQYMAWYPHVEVLRQPAANAWPEVIEHAKKRLIDNYCQDPTENRQKMSTSIGGAAGFGLHCAP